MKKNTILTFTIMVVLTILCSQGWAKNNSIQLKAVQFLNFGNPGESGFHLLVDMINEASQGQLNIKIVGGPESIPGRQQTEAVKTGAVDIAFVPAPWYKSMLPVGPIMNVSLLDPREERESGFYNYLVNEHEKIGIRYIGNAHVQGPFYLYSKEPINNLEGLKGKRFRHSPAYPFYQAIGLTPITSAHSEIYPGLERSMFDGLAINHTNFINLNLYEVCKYVIGPGFYPRGAAAVIMNLDKFEGLPDELQEVIINSMEKAEPIIRKMDKDIEKVNWETLESKGVKHIEWSAEENEIFLNKVIEVTWEVEGKKFDPDVLKEIKKMTGF